MLDAGTETRRERLLKAAGGLGGPFRKSELAALAGGKRQDTLGLIDDLRATGALAESHGRYSLAPVGRTELADGGADDALDVAI